MSAGDVAVDAVEPDLMGITNLRQISALWNTVKKIFIRVFLFPGCLLDGVPPSAPPDVPPRNPTMNRMNGRVTGNPSELGVDFEPSCLVRTPSGNVYIPSGNISKYSTQTKRQILDKYNLKFKVKSSFAPEVDIDVGDFRSEIDFQIY